MQPEVISREQLNDQVERIVGSRGFRHAATLQRLLRYVSAKPFDVSPELKEYTIGVEVLGRPCAYDTKTDTIVRVQMHRLREKLREYYDGEGIHDSVFIEMPKGKYVPNVELRTVNGFGGGPADPKFSALETEELSAARTPEFDSKPRDVSVAKFALPQVISLGGIVAATILLLLIGFLAGLRVRGVLAAASSTSTVRAADKTLDDNVRDFWSGIVATDSAPIIAYPDAVFLLDENNDLLRFRRGARDGRGAPVDTHLANEFASSPDLVARAGPLFYENGYTGTGELESVASLVGVLVQMGVHPTLKRGSEITIDDLRHHNLIMLGSSFQNNAVAQLPATGSFRFENPEPRRELWRGRIRNSHPQLNEAATYRTERDPTTQIVKTDYALLSVKTGIAPGRYIAMLAGLDTIGTAGAASFATSANGIDDLSRELRLLGERRSSGKPSLFEAVLKVDIQDGCDVTGVRLTKVYVGPVD